MKRMLLALIIAGNSATGAAQGQLERGVRPDVYQGLVKTRDLLVLTPEEFGSLLASQQQHEIAATTSQPTQQQLVQYARVQALNKVCLTQLAPKVATRQGQLPWISNTLEVPARLKTFLDFTSKTGLRKADESVLGLSGQQACAQASALVR